MRVLWAVALSRSSFFFFLSSRRRHTRFDCDWSSDVCSSDLSGYFGEWIQDEFGLPAFHYTCDQTKDPKAVTEVNPGILSATEHIHQVGNDRIVAIASNYGHVRVRQDEGA